MITYQKLFYLTLKLSSFFLSFSFLIIIPFNSCNIVSSAVFYITKVFTFVIIKTISALFFCHPSVDFTVINHSLYELHNINIYVSAFSWFSFLGNQLIF